MPITQADNIMLSPCEMGILLSVEPPDLGHFGTNHSVHYRETVLFLEVLCRFAHDIYTLQGFGNICTVLVI